MQIELDPLSMVIGFVLGILTLFLVTGFQKLFNFSYGEIGTRILERYRRPRKGLQVEVLDCVHTRKYGKTVVYVRLEFSNPTKAVTRVSSISIMDKKGNILDFNSAFKTEFQIRGNESMVWTCYCQDISGRDTNRVKLKLEVARREGKKVKKKLTSIFVDEGKFPAEMGFSTF